MKAMATTEKMHIKCCKLYYTVSMMRHCHDNIEVSVITGPRISSTDRVTLFIALSVLVCFKRDETVRNRRICVNNSEKKNYLFQNRRYIFALAGLQTRVTISDSVHI